MTCSPEFVAAPDWTVAVRSVPSADWDEFVDRFPNRPVYMRSGWSALAREVFGHETFFIEARDNSGALLGTLPLVQQRGLLGNFITIRRTVGFQPRALGMAEVLVYGNQYIGTISFINFLIN